MAAAMAPSSLIAARSSAIQLNAPSTSTKLISRSWTGLHMEAGSSLSVTISSPHATRIRSGSVQVRAGVTATAPSKIGDMVVYSKYAGTEVQFDDAEHVLLKEDDLIGFLSTDDIKDLKPLNERVLIKIAEAEDKTSGGIILTENAKEKPVTGTAVAVGSGAFGEDGVKKPLDIAPGNSVMYSKYAGNEFKSKDGSEYVVIRASDILAVLP
ncbi:20 kDa chaperonin, chloroplastic-like [Selaginella moellendorffii]|uniref:20 kDa chaperonin, chloroplastic-like n=1 Tax=Selaginella moellendorffii TaxID=88036 RepID=UPI000D1CAA9D|nr:20 kDa chaperonin, chloroplastic-like [Selaginella moellendorffii]|eukprot:XP_024534889.1 20 kDa chaperonin, chloroplastic-like [Selaginella moellendorffii]